MDPVTLCGLIRIVMPGYTIRICDGGFVYFDGDLYQSEDEKFGIIAGFQMSGMEDGQAPGGKLTFLTGSAEAAAELVAPGFQTSELDIWLAEIDPSSATVIGVPNLLVSGKLDRPIIFEGRGTRRIEIDFVSESERLMVVNEGNSLNGTFHKRLFPGEKGFDNALGMSMTDYWGVQGPARGVSYVGGGGGFGDRVGGMLSGTMRQV